MTDPEIQAWREAERLARAAENLVPRTAPAADPRRRILAARAGRLRKDADQRFAALVQKRGALGSPDLELAPRDDDPARESQSQSQSQELDAWIQAWQRADRRAQAAEDKVVTAYASYAAGQGPLPSLVWESDAAMLRMEAAKRIERVYAEAKRIRKPTRDDFKESAPGLMGGRDESGE